MTEYSDDAPEITDDTQPEELIEYADSRVSEPIQIGETTVYHFASHEPDMEAMEYAVENKLRRSEYIVPLQVTSGMVFLHSILPRQIREAELLIYRRGEEEYYAYSNLCRSIPEETQAALRQKFAEEI